MQSMQVNNNPPPNSTAWSQSISGTQHFTQDGFLYSISLTPSFALLVKYSWVNSQVVGESTFFLCPSQADCISNPEFFWGCEEIDFAVSWAKIVALGNPASRTFVYQYKQNMATVRDYLTQTMQDYPSLFEYMPFRAENKL
jgi:hypothetical protein